MQLQIIQQRIFETRGQKVMLDFDLAKLYEVETKALNQAVKRNIERFPDRFMFKLTIQEWDVMRSQFVTASQNKRNVKATPFAFTEHGVTMLASVLRSKRAVKMNIAIVEAFITLKEYALTYKELAKKIEALEEAQSANGEAISNIHKAIKELLEPIYKQRNPIGFKRPEKKLH